VLRRLSAPTRLVFLMEMFTFMPIKTLVMEKTLFDFLTSLRGTSSESPKFLRDISDKDIDEDALRGLASSGYVIIRESNGTIWLTQAGKKEIAIQEMKRKAKAESARKWAEYLDAKRREHFEAYFNAEKEAKNVEISAEILSGLIPGEYLPTEDKSVFTDKTLSHHYELIPKIVFECKLKWYIEEKIIETFKVHIEDIRDCEEHMLIRTPEEVLADPLSREMFAVNCFWADDIAYEDDTYVVMIPSDNHPFFDK